MQVNSSISDIVSPNPSQLPSWFADIKSQQHVRRLATSGACTTPGVQRGSLGKWWFPDKGHAMLCKGIQYGRMIATTGA